MHPLDEAPTGTRLEYLFAKAVGYELIGSEHGPFAVLSRDCTTIAVFGNKKSVKHASFKDECADIPLQMAESLGACFSVKDGLAVCEIGDIVTTGADFMEATLRALLTHLSSTNAEG